MCGTRRHAYTPEHVRRAEDCPPYLRSGFVETARGRPRPQKYACGQRYCLQAFTAPVLSHPKKDLKAVLFTGWHCGQDGRAPVWRGARASTPAETYRPQRHYLTVFHGSCTRTPQEKPQTRSVYQQALRPGWPRARAQKSLA